MTTVDSVGSAEVRAAPKAKVRNFSIDRARTFLTLVVLIHHAVIPYTYFGHTDPKSFFGFDMIVLATDSFFMAMFFFLSGLFVWPSIARKGPLNHLTDRLLRLGLPFVICALTVIPVAYYAISLRLHPEIGFSEFWWKTITVGPWPSGPIWFLWVLFGFDLVACLLFRLSPTMLEPINRLSMNGHERPGEFFVVMFAVTAALYVPGRIHFGAGSWFEFGAVLGPAWPRAALCELFLFRRRHRRPEYGSRAVGSGQQAGSAYLELGLPGARSVLF